MYVKLFLYIYSTFFALFTSVSQLIFSVNNYENFVLPDVDVCLPAACDLWMGAVVVIAV